MDPLSYFSFQSVLHEWFNQGRGMCCPVYGMMYIKQPHVVDAAGFLTRYLSGPLPLCPTPYNGK